MQIQRWRLEEGGIGFGQLKKVMVVKRVISACARVPVTNLLEVLWSRLVCQVKACTFDIWITIFFLRLPFFIIGSAEALPILCVRYFRWERERERDTDRERDRERRKWRHHCRAKIGDEFTLSLAKNSHNWRWAYTFACQKFALFVSPFTLPVSLFAERSPWWRWNSQWVHTFHCQKFFRPQALFPLFQMARAARRVIENPRQMIKSCPVPFFFPSKNWIKLIPKTIGNRKRDCAWVGSGW